VGFVANGKTHGPSEDPQSRPAKSPDDLRRKAADEVVKSGLSGWWEHRTDVEKRATLLIAAALAIGPLGQGIIATFGVLFGAGSIPTSKQLEAVLWLFLITAPLATFVIVLVSLWFTPPAWLFAGMAAVFAALVLSTTDVPKSLAGVYCYAEISGGGVVYERQCRDFKAAGFYAENAPRVGNNRSESAKIFASAVAYTSDARGSVMAVASILASIGIGLIIRERV
jgi:hypothetical protein